MTPEEVIAKLKDSNLSIKDLDKTTQKFIEDIEGWYEGHYPSLRKVIALLPRIDPRLKKVALKYPKPPYYRIVPAGKAVNVVRGKKFVSVAKKKAGAIDYAKTSESDVDAWDLYKVTSAKIIMNYTDVITWLGNRDLLPTIDIHDEDIYVVENELIADAKSIKGKKIDTIEPYGS